MGNTPVSNTNPDLARALVRLLQLRRLLLRAPENAGCDIGGKVLPLKHTSRPAQTLPVIVRFVVLLVLKRRLLLLLLLLPPLPLPPPPRPLPLTTTTATTATSSTAAAATTTTTMCSEADSSQYWCQCPALKHARQNVHDTDGKPPLPNTKQI